MDHENQLVMNNNSLSALTLSQGSLNKIKNGDQLIRPSLQVLDIIPVNETQYDLVVSDGRAMTLAILSPALKPMVENNQLTKHSVIELTSYTMQRKCLSHGKSELYIFILRIDVKALGQDGSMRLGRPVHLITLSPVESKNLVNHQQEEEQQQRDDGKIMIGKPILSFGVLLKIRKGDYVEKPVLQILKIEEFKHWDGTTQWKLDISDGQTIGNFALLDNELDWIIASNQLARYSVVEVADYLVKPIKHDEKNPGPFIPQIMEVYDITMKATGQQVDGVIGDPIPRLIDFTTILSTFSSRDNVQLTTGILDMMMKGAKVNKPIVQILKVERMKLTESNSRYMLVLSDGINVEQLSILDKKLNFLITNHTLSKFTIIEVTNHHVINHQFTPNKQTLLLVISGINIKQPGQTVGRHLIKPLVPIDNSKAVAQSQQLKTIQQLKLEAQKLDNDLKSLNQMVEKQKNINAALLDKQAESIKQRDHLVDLLIEQEVKNHQLIHENELLNAETYVIQENLNDLYQRIQLQSQFLDNSNVKEATTIATDETRANAANEQGKLVKNNDSSSSSSSPSTNTQQQTAVNDDDSDDRSPHYIQL